MRTKILVTGGAGFIGSRLVDGLFTKGYEVTVLDNLSEQVHGKNPKVTSPLFASLPSAVRFIYGSVTCKEDWLKAIKGQDIVVHLAAETGTGQSMYEIERYTNVNINGTAILLDILANSTHNVQKVLVASSRSIYGEGKYFSKELGIVYPDKRSREDLSAGDFEVKYAGATSPLKLLPTDEESKLHPSSIYGITKQTQEQMVLTASCAMEIPAVALRYQNVYGPGQSLKNPYTGILSIFSTLIKKGQQLNIFEDGAESRDFVFIDDVVKATILAIEMPEANDDVFNVGSGTPTSVLTVANQLIKNYNIDVPVVVSGNFRVGDIRHNYADLTKIKNRLGFVPEYDFEKGIELFVHWVESQQIQDNQFENSLQELKQRGLYK